MATTEMNLLGKPMTEQERELLDIYERLKKLAASDLPPCALHNIRKALASLWLVTNDLDLQFEQLYDVGV